MIGVLLLLAGTLVCSFAQVLELEPGRVHGFEYSTKGGEVAEVFLGIPYAAAPVGELRFEAPAGGYPILLWVHGGGYEIGSASLYGYKGFADIYIPHDIIVDTLQYRLGVYGIFFL
ncbi:unnamed protein product [Haemonchus placei]|uniref:COesterase domain-containing protein n=1 Tax=Haemonchus placei TaxID=6290 RepID=A0A0N4VWY6_HAEPC|nr:unnamed protein product [Haemonchus placei]